MSLFSLVYVSFANSEMTYSELQQILEQSRYNNQQNNITGMLLYRDGFFIQALEGDKNTVEALYDRISQDQRHRNVLLVCTEEVDQRNFGDWSMGFNQLSDEDVSYIPGFTDFLENPDDANFILEHPGHATDLLESFKHRTYF